MWIEQVRFGVSGATQHTANCWQPAGLHLARGRSSTQQWKGEMIYYGRLKTVQFRLRLSSRTFIQTRDAESRKGVSKERWERQDSWVRSGYKRRWLGRERGWSGGRMAQEGGDHLELGEKCGRSFLLEVFHPAVSKARNKDVIIRTTFSSGTYYF